MAYRNIKLEKSDAIATITLNRPQKRNAFNEELLEEFIDAKNNVAEDAGSKVLIITGAGTAFCSGYDFSSPRIESADQITSMRMREDIISQEKHMLALRALPKPVIAMINGPVVGAGLGFYLSCDLAIASEDSIFSFRFVQLGRHPEAGITFLLPRIVGSFKSCEILFLGKTIGSKEAQELGLINMVVPKNELVTTTLEIAKNIASGPSVAIGLAKISLYQSWASGIRAALENEARANAICSSTEDYKEALKAFREKREPIFKGR